MIAKKTPDTDLIAELRHLRTVSRLAAENFILRCEADIEAALSLLSRMPPATLRRKQPGWSRQLKSLKLKPEKGRLKDLKELHCLVEKLLADVLDEAEGKPRKKKTAREAPAVGTVEDIAASAAHHP